jgi:hypothetical protein
MRLDFENYLNLHDLGELLVLLDDIYDALLYAFAPDLRNLPRYEATRLRFRTARQGSAIIEITTGIAQVIQSIDPALKASIAGPLTLAGLIKLVKDTADWALDFRRRQRELAAEEANRELDLTQRRQELAVEAAQQQVDLVERQRTLEMETRQRQLDLIERQRALEHERAGRSLELLPQAQAALQDLAIAQFPGHAEAAQLALQQAALREVGPVVATDLEKLQNLFIRSRIDSISFEQDENGNEQGDNGAPALDGAQPSDSDASDSTTR